MITFSKFGKHGRLGNQLFQYAAMIGFSVKYKQQFTIPNWHYGKYFNRHQNQVKADGVGTAVVEKAFSYTPEYYDAVFKNYKDVDLIGYFQSEKYWLHCKDEVKKALGFNRAFFSSLQHNWPVDNDKRNIAISVRRGDYVDNPNYELLPITYYFLALLEYFPNWFYFNLLIFSDDPEWCKIHFGCLPNTYIIPNSFDNLDKTKYFDENRSAMVQLALMSLCDHFIIANSTFSWWGAYLGEKEHSIIVRPSHYFDGNLKMQCDIKDHYPDRWRSFDHKQPDGRLKKIPLNDVTFTIPVSHDHNDRKENLELNIAMLQKHFDTNIIVAEQGTNVFFYTSATCRYFKFDSPHFHRTKMLNDMADMATTPIIANWDADVFIAPLQIWITVMCIRGGADIAYPYDGRFARVPRKWLSILSRMDIGLIRNNEFPGMGKEDALSVGGALFFNKEAFFKAGGENENFISYGPEDVERWERFNKLELQVERIKGVLYHLDHFIGVNSSSKTNVFRYQNQSELQKIQSLDKNQLIQYIKTWAWNRNH